MNPSNRRRSIVAILIACMAVIVWQMVAHTGAPPSLPAVTKTSRALVTHDEVASVDEPLSVTPAAAPAPVPVRGLPTDAVLPMRQDLRWQEPMPEPAFASFREWTGRFAQARTAADQAALVGEGLALAVARRSQMAVLIDQNPQRALELAVPVAARRKLPPEIVAQLEEPVAGRGDLWVAAAIPAPGEALGVRPVQRTLKMRDGREFDTFTFGRRDNVPTRENIAVQGIAIDGKLALTELPGRVLEPVEVADLHAAGEAAAVCPTSGKVTTQQEEVAVDWDGGSHTFFCGPGHALDALVSAYGDEAMAGGPPGDGVIAYSTKTEGVKKLLIIRVDFPDFAGQVVSDATLTSLINNMGTHWAEMSFAKMSWAPLGAGSDFTPTLRLPNGHASYTGFGTMLTAARTAATAAGFNYTNYTHEVVVTGSKPAVGFGGVAYVGARGAWLANSQWNLGVCSHEVGHNFGLLHSGFWDTTDGSVIGAGAAVEYGNPFDHMGGASSSTDAHFGARQKNYLDWIADVDVTKITANGTTTTRIRAFDKSAAVGTKSLAVDRTGTTNDYWVEYRQTYTDTNKWMLDGVVLNWGDVTISNMQPVLLDWTPSTSSKDDCPLLIGRTFSDTVGGIHITPVARGTDPNGVAWIDVTVNRGPFTGNRKPTATVGASNVNPAVNGSVTFTATASDLDGDTLGYFWDWGDGTFTANNSTTASKSWSSSGTKTVRCYVTDMKGLTTIGQLLVQVGTSSTFFIQGTVKTASGDPLVNVVVKAGATSNDSTDSEGYYAITGLAAGSYTMTGTLTGLTFQPGNFTNPVVVGPSKQNINLISPPGVPTFGTMKPGLFNQGSNTGPVIVPVSDSDTPVTSLTLTPTSSNTAVIPNASITFGTVGTTVRTITAAAAASVSGPVDITITATDPQGATASYIYPVTVNAKPVLSGLTANTAENSPLDIDLRTLVADDLTADADVSFDLSRVLNGTVDLLADGYTARFTPAPDYQGAASFRLAARDQSLGPRLLFLYDFEPPDVSTNATATDVSNHNRTGSLQTAGSGGEYAYNADVPGLLAPHSTQSLSITEVGTGAARISRSLATTDLDYNDADWTFSTWVKRASNETNDIILHLGDGDGFGPDVELQLYFPANSDTLKVATYGAAGLEKEAVGPAIPVGTWHHVTLTYGRTATKVGTLTLYVDGFAYGSVASVAMNVNQAIPLAIGGAASTSSGQDAWLDGLLDDVMLQSGLSARAEIWGLAQTGARHFQGLAVSASLAITVSGVNQAPAVSTIPDVYLPLNGASPPITVLLSDAETEARDLTATVVSSTNTSLLPVSGIALGAAPAAWTSGDIGAVGASGSLIQDHGTFVVGGAGADIGPATGDKFRWVRQDFSGNGDIIARVASMDFTDAAGKAGVMMRNSTTTTSPYALVAVTPGNGLTFQYRATESTAAVVNATVNGIAAPCWVRLVRTGGNFTAYYATDTGGVAGAWLPVGTTQAITFPAATPAIGLAVTSKVDATVCTAVFDHLGGTVKLGGERTMTVTPTAGTSGSVVVTLNASDGAATTARTFNVIVEDIQPTTRLWNAINTSGSLPWSTGGNWSGGTPPPSSRFSTVDFLTGITLPVGTITSNVDTASGHAMNVLTLGGNGPVSGTSTVAITGNPLLLRQETVLTPVVNLSATNGTGLTYNISAPLSLDATTGFQGDGTAAFILSGGSSGAGGLIKSGTSKLILSGDNTYLGTTTISGGILQIGNDGATGTLPAGAVINNASLRFDRSGTLTVASAISGSGGIIINAPLSADTVVLSGANSYSGGTNIQSGRLQVDPGGTPGAPNGGVTMGTGSLVGNLTLNTSAQIGSLVVSSNTATTTGTNIGQLTIASGSTLTVSSISTGVAGDTKTALGTVGGGTLTVNGAFTMSPAASGTSASTVVNLSGLGTFNQTHTAGSMTIGSAQNSNATLTLANTANTINVGTLSIASSTSNYNFSYSTLNLGAGTNTLLANTIIIGAGKGSGAVQFAGALGSVNIDGTNGTGAAAITLGNSTSNTYVPGNNNSALLLAGHTATVNAATVIVSRMAGNTGSAPISNVTFDTGNFDAASVQLALSTSGASGGSPMGTFTVGGPTANSLATGVLNVTNDFYLAGNTNSTAGAVGIATGALIINGGTVDINTAASATGGIFDTTTSTTGSSNTTLTLAGGALNLNGGVIGGIIGVGKKNIGTLNFLSGTLQNVKEINDGAALIKTGTGTLTLTGTNTYSGPTTISAGTLAIGASGTIGSGNYSPGITNHGILNVATSAAQTLSGVMSGTGSLTKSGTGTLTLTGANTYMGSTSVSIGTLVIGNSSGLSTTTGISMAGGTLLQANHAGGTINAPITVGATGTTASITGPLTGPTAGVVYALTLNGPISGAGNVTYTSSQNVNTLSTVHINAQGTYAGSTLFNTTATTSGTTTASNQIIVKLGIANALPPATVLTIDGGNGAGTGRFAELNLNGFNQQLAGLTNIARNLRIQRVVNSDVSAAATLTVNNTSNYTFSGNLGSNSPSGSVSVTAMPGTANGNNFGLTKSGIGTFTLTGANTYSGNTTVSQGTLSLGVINPSNEASTVTIAATGALLKLNFAGTDTVDKLFIGTSQLAAGVYEAVGNPGSGIEIPQLSGTGTLTVTSGQVVTGYATWKTANGTTQALDLDHDDDGVPNGIEYFLGGSTNTTGFTPRPSVVNTAGVLSITWTKAASYTGTYGTDFWVETSATLANPWTTETSGVNVTFPTATEVKYTFPAGTTNFARLKVTGP